MATQAGFYPANGHSGGGGGPTQQPQQPQQQRYQAQQPQYGAPPTQRPPAQTPGWPPHAQQQYPQQQQQQQQQQAAPRMQNYAPRPAGPGAAQPAPAAASWGQYAAPQAAAPAYAAAAPQGQTQGAFWPQQTPGQSAGSPAVMFSAPQTTSQQPAMAPVGGAMPPGSDFFQNPVMAQIGMQYGQRAFMHGQEYVQKNLTRYVDTARLRYYFTLSNSYVLRKIRLVLFPYRNKSWARVPQRAPLAGDGQAGGAAGGSEFQPPRDDLNAPDLYIPAMGFVTYILVRGILLGRGGRFHPEVLGVTSSTALTVIALQILAVKFGCYLLSISSAISWLDLAAFIGYQFIPVLVTLFTLVLHLPAWVKWAVFTYGMLSLGFFTLRTLRHFFLVDAVPTPNGGLQYAAASSSFPSDPAASWDGSLQSGEMSQRAGSGVSAPSARALRQKRIKFLFIMVGLEILCSFVLVLE